MANFTTGTETTHYVGGVLEKLVTASNTQYKHFIAGPSGLVAIYTRRVNANPTLEDTFYFTRDHQGNVDSITKADGSVQVRLSYDAFGKRRNEAGWSGPVPGSDWTGIANSSRRGYTEHEHLDNLGLIHMNGRVQDPLIGRFLSADPFVPDPWDGQSFNRYSYVRNNPLSRVDPTGFTDDWWCRFCIDFNPVGGPNSGRAIAPNLYGTGALSYTPAVLAVYMDTPGQGPSLSASASTEVDQHNQPVAQGERATAESVNATDTLDVPSAFDAWARLAPMGYQGQVYGTAEDAVRAAARWILDPARKGQRRDGEFKTRVDAVKGGYAYAVVDYYECPRSAQKCTSSTRVNLETTVYVIHSHPTKGFESGPSKDDFNDLGDFNSSEHTNIYGIVINPDGSLDQYRQVVLENMGNRRPSRFNHKRRLREPK